MNKQKQAIDEFEGILNKAKVNVYSKISLEKPLSKSGLEDFKEAVCNQYGFSKEELEKSLKGGKQSKDCLG